jgi:ABC-type lipoprotein release transport system permease subunit
MTHLPVSPVLLVPLGGAALLFFVLLVVGRVPLAYNLRNLTVRWWTTLLTAVAFAVVLALLTVMLAFVSGMRKLTEGSGRPENVIVMSDGATDEGFSTLNPVDIGDVDRRPAIAWEGGKPLASKEVYIIANQEVPESAAGKAKRRFLQVRGVEDPVVSGRVHGLELYPGGEWFSEGGVATLEGGKDGKPARTAIEAVLGDGVARELGRDVGKERLDVNDQFDLGDRKWKVVGVMRSSGATTFGSEIWAKREYMAEIFRKRTISSVVLRAKDAAAAGELVQDLNDNFKKANLKAQPEIVYYEKLSGISTQFLVAAIFLTLIMAIGGIFGVMNTMFAAISQRTKDIGMLRILGFARWQVLVSFLLESLLIALVGGVLGLALGSLCNGWTATSIIGSGQGGFGKTVVLKLVVDANTLVAGLLLTVFMGAVGGLIPALSAMRLRPLESLR